MMSTRVRRRVCVDRAVSGLFLRSGRLAAHAAADGQRTRFGAGLGSPQRGRHDTRFQQVETVEELGSAQKMIALLSPGYLESVYGGQEWRAVLAADPIGFTHKLLPVRIEECDRPGLLRTVVGFDLFGLEPEAACAHLLEQVGHSLWGRASAPEFPVPVRPAPPVGEPEFPPAQDPGSSRIAFGANLATLTGHTRTVWQVVFSPDGALLATCSGNVRLWDVPSGPRAARRCGPRRRHRDAHSSTRVPASFNTAVIGRRGGRGVRRPARGRPAGQGERVGLVPTPETPPYRTVRAVVRQLWWRLARAGSPGRRSRRRPRRAVW